MTKDIDRAKAIYEFEPTRFDQFFATQVSLRGILGAMILDENGDVVTRVILDPNAQIPLAARGQFLQGPVGRSRS